MRIGIICFASGAYVKFWHEFYSSCEEFLFPDVVKGYEFFTDKCNESFKEGVTCHRIVDEGFISNLLNKWRYICDISERLRTEYDYLFCVDITYRPISTILSAELFVDGEYDLLALSRGNFHDNNQESFSYERNPASRAFIPFGTEGRCYQTSLYGGSVSEGLALSEWCAEQIDVDLKNGAVSELYDTAYFNRYMINKNPKVIDDYYAYGYSLGYTGDYKAQFIDEEAFLGERDFFQAKGAFLNRSMSFLLNKSYKIDPIGVVSITPGLGNQMFQYAYYLYQSLNTNRKFYLDISLCEFVRIHNGYELNRVFNVDNRLLVDDCLRANIRRATQVAVCDIRESSLSVFNSLSTIDSPISIHLGYWQSFKYVNEVASEVREAFKFDESKLNIGSAELAACIRSSHSVGMHIRRGDYYSNPKTRVIMGDICTEDYYDRALMLMKKKHPEIDSVFVFTDDSCWVEENMPVTGATIVTCNKGEDSWQDMFLMSLCENHIISNSSFSWWAAWLSENRANTVIAPSIWYNGVDVPDLLPPTWIRIPVDGRDLYSKVLCPLLLNNSRSVGMDGKLGISIICYEYARRTDDSTLNDLAGMFLDELCDSISLDMPLGFDNGICGIGWGITYLIKNKFVEEDDNVLALLESIDERVTSSLNFPKFDNLSVADGFCGAGRYLISRLNYLGDSNLMLSLRLGEFLIYLIDMIAEKIPDYPDDIDDVFKFISEVKNKGFYPTGVERVMMACVMKNNGLKRLLYEFDK